MTTMRENLQGRIDELRTLRDQIRVDLNLAALELRDEWRQIERRLPDSNLLARQVKEVTGEALDEILAEARQFRQRLTGEAGPANTVARLMTRDVAACGPDDSLSEAARKMWRHDVGSLPVVDGEGRVLAMVTDRDACMAAYIAGRPLEQIPVRTAMSRELYACGPNTALVEVEALMRTRQVRRLPVVEGDGHLVGMLTLADLARASRTPSGEGAPGAAQVAEVLAGISAPRPAGAERGES